MTGAREDYTYNGLNQVVTKENNSLASSGTTAAANTVTVDGAAAGRQGTFYSGEVLPPAQSAPANYGFLVGITPPGQPTSTESRSVLALPNLQSFQYDLDGNLATDGMWDYTWDGENRLVRMATTTLAAANGVANRELTFKYDHLGRRMQKRVVNLVTGTEISSRRFVYDGWNLIAEFSAPGGSSIGAIARSYTWGLDILSSITSAGGVAALLQIADHGSAKTYLPTYDGNGNVATLLNGDTGFIAATYEYSPFGEPLRAVASDSTVADQPFRFSTKFLDIETGLVYYGRRYYDPRLGRWITRDPKEELGGVNLYGFVGNNAINKWDYLGMCEGAEDPTGDDGYVGDGDGGDGGIEQWLDEQAEANRREFERWADEKDAEAERKEKANAAGSSQTPDATKNGTPETETLKADAGRNETGVRTTTGDTKADEKVDGTRGRANEDDRLKKPTPTTPPPEPTPSPVGGLFPDNGQPHLGIPKNSGALPPFTSPPKDLIPYGGSRPPPPGSNWNRPEPKVVLGVAAGVGASYLVYRGVRMIPSLVCPPLWPTIPLNAAIP